MEFNRKVLLHVGALVAVGFAMRLVGPENSLDAHIYYTGEEARGFLKGLGKGQSYFYFINELLDLLFIFLYSTLAFFTVKKIFKTLAMAPWAALIPGVFDLIETSTILFILKVGDTLEVLNGLGVITFLKWSSGALLVLLVISKIVRDSYWRPSK